MYSIARKLVLAAALATAGFTAAPASATITIVDPCSAGYVTGAIACVGYVSKNQITGSLGSNTTAAEQEIINQLLSGPATSSTGSYAPPYALNTTKVLGALTGLNGSNIFNFGTAAAGSLTMSGLTVLGAHFGNTTDSEVNSVTAFWLFNFTTPTSTIYLTNGQGSSNAQIFATGPGAVPEPTSWALMLLGFGVIGSAMRRSSRRRGPVLLQIA